MFFDEDLIRLHQEVLLREADRSRLVAQLRQRSTRRRHSYTLAFAWLGIRLCRWGSLLQERYGGAESAPPSQSMNNSLKV